MLNIYCTKKLQNFIGNVETELPTDTVQRSLWDWNAHLFFVDRKKCLVFVNNLTAYSIFITDILKKDLQNIDQLFRYRLNEQLQHDKVISKHESLELIFQFTGLKFYKTNNDRKTIGRINDFVEMFKTSRFYKYEHLNDMNIVYENGLFNATPTGKPGEMKKTWSSPIENLRCEI